MAGHRKFSELRAGLADQVGEERLAAAEASAQGEYAVARVTLGELRRARTLTQVQLSRALGVSQSQVSRIEKQGDLFLSTLASYIEAMGGRLELRAVFDHTDPLELDIGAIADDVADTRRETPPEDSLEAELGLERRSDRNLFGAAGSGSKTSLS